MKINFEYAYLAVFVAVFLLVGVGGVFENRLSHPLPTGYFASDSFFHQSEAQYMKEQGRVYYAQPSIVGNHQDVLDIHPPYLFEAAATFSKVSGLEVYDAIYLLSILFILLSALIVYFIIRTFNKYAAMLSMPLTVLVFTQPFNQMINFGQWLFIPGAMFMLASFWATTKLKEKRMFIVLGTFLAATAIAHQPELLFALGFLGLYIVIEFVRSRYDLKTASKDIIAAALAGVIALILSLYSLIIFALTWVESYAVPFGFTTDTQMAARGFAHINFVTLGIAGVVVLIGFALFIVSKKKTENYAAIISIYMVLISLLTYIGLGKRAFAHRWLWHIYLAVFFGIAIYYLVKFVIKKWNSLSAAGAAIAALLILAVPLYGDVRGTLMDPYNWDALSWVKENTPKNATINYFYVGNLEQSPTTYNTQRLSRIIVYQDYFSEVKDHYKFGLAYAYDQYACKKGPLSFGYYSYLEENSSDTCSKEYPGLLKGEVQKDTKVCDIEYYYFNSFGRIEGAVQLNNAFRQLLLKNSWIQEVYNNQGVSILKNNEPGRDCLDE